MQFIAAAQILVYAGAILVLFLFVIMLLDLGRAPAGPAPILVSRAARIAAGLALALGTMGLIAAQSSHLAAPDRAAQAAGIDDVTLLAAELFGRYSLPFEAAGMLLLATIVCVIVLAKRQRPGENQG
jgi:NADH-quinone oxidoreductase subunit J